MPMPTYLLENKATREALTSPPPSAFQRQIYWRNVEWVRYGIPADGALAPGYPDIVGMLEAHARGEPAHKNIRFEHVDELDQDRLDFGLCQLNSQYIELEWDYRKNLRTAFGMWQRRGFSPWVAYSNGNYKAFMPDARAAVRRVRQ